MFASLVSTTWQWQLSCPSRDKTRVRFVTTRVRLVTGLVTRNPRDRPVPSFKLTFPIMHKRLLNSSIILLSHQFLKERAPAHKTRRPGVIISKSTVDRCLSRNRSYGIFVLFPMHTQNFKVLEKSYVDTWKLWEFWTRSTYWSVSYFAMVTFVKQT